MQNFNTYTDNKCLSLYYVCIRHDISTVQILLLTFIQSITLCIPTGMT